MAAKLKTIGLLLMLANTALGEPVPAPQPPRPAASATSNPQMVQQRKLLNEKLAERDRLNREIDELRKAVDAHEQILIRVELLTVEHSQLRKLGFDFDMAAPNGGLKAKGEDILNGKSPLDREGMVQFVQTLKKANLAKVLANPCVMTTSGRPASVHVGGTIPMPQPSGVEYEKIGMLTDVLAEDLGDNRVRLAIRQEVSNASEENAIVVNDQRVRSIQTVCFDTTLEAVYGETQVLVGPLSKHVVEGYWPLSKSQTEYVTTLMLITAEAADGMDPQVRPASADAPASSPSLQ